MRSWLALIFRFAGFVVSPVGYLAYKVGQQMSSVSALVMVVAVGCLILGPPDVIELVDVRGDLTAALIDAPTRSEIKEAALLIGLADLRTVAPFTVAGGLAIGRLRTRSPRQSASEGIDLGNVRGGGLQQFRDGEGLVFRPEILRRHAVVVGSTGSGKTTTIMNLAEGAAQLGWSVWFIDAKGDHQNARTFYSSCVRAGIDRIDIAGWPYEPWASWRGDARAIANRVLATQDFTEPYYRETARLALKLATGAPGTGTPSSSADFLDRLSDSWVKRNWKGHALGRQWLDLDPKTPHGTAMRFSGFFSAIGEKLTERLASKTAGPPTSPSMPYRSKKTPMLLGDCCSKISRTGRLGASQATNLRSSTSSLRSLRLQARSPD